MSPQVLTIDKGLNLFDWKGHEERLTPQNDQPNLINASSCVKLRKFWRNISYTVMDFRQYLSDFGQYFKDFKTKLSMQLVCRIGSMAQSHKRVFLRKVTQI